MNEILSAISTVGFPIVCCGALFWHMINVQEGMRQTIENNTKVLSQIYAVLDTLTEKPLEEVE